MNCVEFRSIALADPRPKGMRSPVLQRVMAADHQFQHAAVTGSSIAIARTKAFLKTD